MVAMLHLEHESSKLRLLSGDIAQNSREISPKRRAQRHPTLVAVPRRYNDGERVWKLTVIRLKNGSDWNCTSCVRTGSDGPHKFRVSPGPAHGNGVKYSRGRPLNEITTGSSRGEKRRQKTKPDTGYWRKWSLIADVTDPVLRLSWSDRIGSSPTTR